MDMGRRTGQLWSHPALYHRESSEGVAGGDLDQHRPTRQVDPVTVLTATGKSPDRLLLLARMLGRLKRHLPKVTTQ